MIDFVAYVQNAQAHQAAKTHFGASFDAHFPEEQDRICREGEVGDGGYH